MKDIPLRREVGRWRWCGEGGGDGSHGESQHSSAPPRNSQLNSSPLSCRVIRREALSARPHPNTRPGQAVSTFPVPALLSLSNTRPGQGPARGETKGHLPANTFQNSAICLTCARMPTGFTTQWRISARDSFECHPRSYEHYQKTLQQGFTQVIP